MLNSKLLGALLLISLLSQISFAQTPNATPINAKTKTAVIAVLEAQRDAWNRGDVSGYMDGYERSPDTVMVSGDSITHGWQAVHDRYQKNYDTLEKMGTLTFSEIEVKEVGKDAVLMVGRWHLKRPNDEPHGRFTLLFKKTKAGWKIVHDHTSSA